MAEKTILDALSEHAELRLTNVGHASHEKGWCESKRHPDYDVWLVTEGALSVEALGSTMVVRAGDVFFFNPGVPYTAVCPDGPCSHIYVHFDFPLGERYNFLDEFELMGAIGSEHYAEEGERFRAAFEAYRNKEPMASLTLKGYFLALLAKLLAIPSEKAGSRSIKRPRHFARLLPVLRYVEEHLKEHVPAERLAEMAGMSPKYFYAFFKSNIGLTPQNYITRMKMNRAKELLLERKLTVKEIAYQLGYPDPYTFSKVFKRVHKTAPSKLYDYT